MVILDEPFVSEEVKVFLEQSQVPVLDNAFAARAGDGYRFNRVDEAAFSARMAASGETLRLLTVSENSLEWVMRHSRDTAMKDAIALMKDKAAFRRRLAPLYPDFFFREVALDALDSVDPASLPFPCVLKPATGFFSIGVHIVASPQEWYAAVDAIRKQAGQWRKAYPESVVGSTVCIIEEYIEGDEYAIDACYDETGHAVILNIFRHEFASQDDVRDRLYYTSVVVIREHLADFSQWLDAVNRYCGAKRFPVHVEVRIAHDGTIVPVEFNPLRFAGWCCTDLSWFAWGFRTYEYFLNGQKPDWDRILKDRDGRLYTLIVLDKPAGLQVPYRFDDNRLCAVFGKVLHFRNLSQNPHYPVFGFLFTETPENDRGELDAIVKSDLTEFLAPA